MDETKSFEDAAELLTRISNEGKILSEVMTQGRKHVTSDDTLRERLTTSIAKAKDFSETAKSTVVRLKADHEGLVEKMERAREQRKNHLVEKRRLQMTLVDAERKVHNSESMLEELKAQLETLESPTRRASADGDDDQQNGEDTAHLRSEIVALEKKLIVAQASARDNAVLASELKIKESQVADLRQELALSTTESEQKDERIAELERKTSQLESEILNFDHSHDHHDGGSTIMSESVRVRPVSGPPRLERKFSSVAKSENSAGAPAPSLPPVPSRKLNLQKQKPKQSPLSDLPPAVQASVAALLVVSGFAIGRLTKK